MANSIAVGRVHPSAKSQRMITYIFLFFGMHRFPKFEEQRKSLSNLAHRGCLYSNFLRSFRPQRIAATPLRLRCTRVSSFHDPCRQNEERGGGEPRYLRWVATVTLCFTMVFLLRSSYYCATPQSRRLLHVFVPGPMSE